MIQVRLLGGAALARMQAGPERPLSLPPKAVALLGYLCVASARDLHRRDLLLPLLWPDMDAMSARNALSQALFRIRSVVGHSAVQNLGTEEIRVDPEALWCDAREFEAGCRTGRWKDALDLYGGDFMAGLHVSSAPGFELWQEMERARLQRRALQAASKVAEQARAEGHAADAVLSLRRGLEIVPTDEHILRQLMWLLDEIGEPTGALAAYEEQRVHLLRDLDVEPSSDIQAFAEQIRARASRRGVAGRPRTDPEVPELSGEPGAIASLAVLPFHNLTGDSAEDYFADGMTDALITALGQMRNVRVISRQSSLAYRATCTPLPRIAAELSVDALVEGAVLRAGDRVRITAQLLRARPEAHLWGESYDWALEDVLKIHREVAATIAEQIHGIIPADAQQRSTRATRVDPAAYEAFLKGRHYSAMWPRIDKGVEYFERAILQDPNFAPAHAGLAICYFQMAAFVLLPPSTVLPRLAAAARQALALDQSLSDAHVAEALSLGISRSDWPAATERELERAVALDRNNAYAQAYLGGHKVALGLAEGIAGCEQALRLDPLNPVMLQSLGWAYYRTRQYGAAEQTFRSLLEMYPHLALPHPFLAQIYVQQGREAEAVDACRRSRELNPEHALVLGYGAAILALTGETEEAEDWLETLVLTASRQYVDPYYVAAACAGLGKTDSAFTWLERMSAEASTSFWLLKTDPLFDSLRGDPRFSRMLRRLGFP